MSIRTCLEDARTLASAGRREGEFIQVLIAAAATSRKRYKREIWDDADSFKNFVYDELGVITGGMKYAVAFPFQGKKTPLEDILYHHLRCQLVHEGEMPESVEFTEPALHEGKKCSVLHLGDPLGFPAAWIETLATAVWLAPENDELWQDDSERRQKAIEGLGNLREIHRFCRRPGQQTKEMKGKNEKIEWTHDGVTLKLSYPPGVSAAQIANGLEEKARELRQ